METTWQRTIRREDVHILWEAAERAPLAYNTEGDAEFDALRKLLARIAMLVESVHMAEVSAYTLQVTPAQARWLAICGHRES